VWTVGWYVVGYLVAAWIVLPLVVILRGNRAVGFRDLFAGSLAAALPGALVYMITHKP
jgi:hypothetical protein